MTPEQLAACGSESGHQKALMCWLALQPDPLLKLAFAIPNGGHRDKITAGRMKAEGCCPGVFDIFLPVARGRCHGLYIEMKIEAYRNRKNGGLSDAQLAFKVAVLEQGYATRVCYSWTEARDVLLAYIALDVK